MEYFPSLGIGIIGAASTLFVALSLWLIVIPYTRVRSYKRADSDVSFFPLTGHFKYMFQDLHEQDDVKASAKSFKARLPNHRFQVTNLGTCPLILLRDPQLIKELALKPQFYVKHDIMELLKVVLGNGLVFSEGEVWKRHRKIISASFNYDFLKDNVGIIQDTTNEFLDKITPNDLEGYSILSKSQIITGEIVGRMFFGEKLSSYTINGKTLAVEFADLLNEIGLLIKNPLSFILGVKVLDIPLPKFRQIKQRIAQFRSVCAKIISDRKSQKELGNDLLGRLLATQSNEDSEMRFSDEDIADEFATFFLAGMDTTAHLVGMLFYCLNQHPEYLKDLADERSAVYNTEGRKTTDMLQKMDVLHAMCKETLRLYTPFPFISTRKCVTDHTLGDLHIKKGDTVEADLFATLYDEKIFENPREFMPNRWRDPNFKYDPYAFIPFSAGPRNCIGQHLAMMEAKVIVSEILNRFEFKMKDDYKLRLTMRFVYEPEEDILLKLTRKV